MKDVVTAWQLKGPDVVNDHADPDVRPRRPRPAGRAPRDATAFLDGHDSGSGSLATYRERLTRALDQAVNGDGRFVASPRVDSYHGVWFELHEDLIQLAGRTREDEVAAGRA